VVVRLQRDLLDSFDRFRLAQKRAADCLGGTICAGHGLSPLTTVSVSFGASSLAKVIAQRGYCWGGRLIGQRMSSPG
jgi:hypothetical protein